MPVAVTGGTERFDLKTLSEGFVVIRRMNHGQKMTRGSLSDKMRFSSSKKSKDVQGEIDLMQREITIWEWTNLIEDHNLEEYINPRKPEEGTRKLDFNRQIDIEKVDAKIAEEISTYISEINNFEADTEDEESELGKSASTSVQGS
jgi:hypothetical protein